MSSITELKARARQIREATIAGENTAVRVGSLFADIVDRLEDAGVDSSLTITPYLDSGVKIASFNQNGNIVSIYSPTGGGSGGGGSVIENPYDDTEIRGLIDALNNTLNATTALANSEKDRLDGVIEDIDNNVKDKMQDAIDFASWIQGNFPQGDITYKSGWDEKTKEYLQVVGMWDTDTDNPVVTTTKWSRMNQTVNQIAMDVTSITTGGEVTSEMIQGWIDVAVEDGIANLNLGTTYATQDDTGEIIKWLYSALKGSTSEYTTFNQLVSAARNGASTAISELRTCVDAVMDGDVLNYVATADMAAKVDDAISEIYQHSESGYSSTSIFSTIDKNSEDIATIVTEATNHATGATIAAKFANWRAGLVTQSDLTSATAGLVATNDYNAAAIVAMINDAESIVKVSADHIDIEGLDIFMHTRDAEGFVTIAGRGLIVTNRTTSDYSHWLYDVTMDGYEAEFTVTCTPTSSLDYTPTDYDPIKFKVTTEGIGQEKGTGSSTIDYFYIGKNSGNLSCDFISWNDDSTIGYFNIGSTTSFKIDGSGSTADGNITWNSSGEISKSAGITVTQNNSSFVIQPITTNGVTYLSIAPKNNPTGGILMSTGGRLGVWDNGAFKVSFDLDERNSHSSTPLDINGFVNSSTEQASYTIKNGLIVLA